MKLPRLPHSSSAMLAFYEASLTHLGALCDRPWHDRLTVIAEGRAASIWDGDRDMVEADLLFPEEASPSGRDAQREIFPGCPLTFRLTEAMRGGGPALQRVVLADETQGKPPALAVAEKLWLQQHPDCQRWHQDTPFMSAHNFSLIVVARAEVQAIDQHWSLHRLALALPSGEADDSLADAIESLVIANGNSAAPIAWPQPNWEAWRGFIVQAMQRECAAAFTDIRQRQARSLRRELDRVEAYFDSYKKELKERAKRSRSDTSKDKVAERIAAAQVERTRRIADQTERHEIKALFHPDALLLVAEPAWQCRVRFTKDRKEETQRVAFIPRLRRWIGV